MFIALIMLIVSQVYAHVQTHQIVYIYAKYVQVFLYVKHTYEAISKGLRKKKNYDLIIWRHFFI